jgi:uncharacterized membrane protein YidH (DUF202 family)
VVGKLDATIEHDVPNSGSTARDHLANEWTFLAWARTGVGFVAMGVAVDSMLQQREGTRKDEEAVARPGTARTHDERSAGAVGLLSVVHLPSLMIVGVGGLFLTYATMRYFQVQSALLRGSFPVNRVGVMGVIAVSSLLVAAGLGIVLVPQGQLGPALRQRSGSIVDTPPPPPQ